jgi:hypothetical protein
VSAICAVCSGPIVRRDAFVLEGTEAMHAECVRQAHLSRARKDAQTILKLKRLVGIEREQVETLTRNLRDAVDDRKRIAMTASEQSERLRDRIRDKEDEVDRLRVLNAGLASQLMTQQPRVVQVTAPAPVVLQSSDPPATDERKDERDASEIRFSLIDLT